MERILENLGLDQIPVLRVLNKQDMVGAVTVRELTAKWEGVPISAHDPQTLNPLLDKIESYISRKKKECHI